MSGQMERLVRVRPRKR